jgi:hypothetical protein
MNIQQDISNKTFTEIKQLAAGHPVFLVTTSDGVFVIKAENSSSGRLVQFSAEIMNHIDSNAASRVLSRNEVMAIRNFAMGNPGSVIETAGTLNTFITNAMKPPLPPTPGQRFGVPQQTAVFTIMQAKNQLNDIESAAMEALGGDKTKVKLFTKAFNEPKNLKRLGLILAADAFNANQDRINFDGPGVKVGPNRLQRIWNPGNIFIADEKKRMTVIGLDNFDPNSMINQSPNNFDATDYPGLYLRADKAGDRNTLLTAVASDIELLLGPRNRKFSFLQQTRLPKNAVQLMEQGMKEGADKILAFLKQKYANGNVGLPMTQRLQALGWLNRANFPRL